MGNALGNQNAAGGDRKSSVHPNTNRRISVKDPRPLSDKLFMLESSRKVVTFLTEHGYDEQMNVKNLQAPSLKVYANILQFCFRFMDPTFTFKGQYEDEIVNMFRALEYPIVLQKADLKVISPIQWPKLLAALTWLVELLQWEETREALESEQAPLDTEDTEAIFFDYLRDAYQMFMDGADDTSALDSRFGAQFEEKNAQIEEECSQLERAMSVLQKDISRLEEQAARLPALRKQKQAYQVDIGKFQDLVAQFEEYIGKVQRKLGGNEKDLAAKKKRLESLMREKESLQARLDAQEATGVDYRKMVQDRMDLEEKAAQLRQTREMAVRMMEENEISLQKLLEVVDAEVQQYTSLAMRLRLLPHAHNNKVPNVSFDLQFKSHAKAEEMIGVDLRNTIKPTLKQLRTSLAGQAKAGSGQLLQLREELDRMQEQADARRDEVSGLESRVESQENALKAMKEALEEDQKQLRLAAKSVRDETDNMTKRALAQLQQSHMAVDKLRVEENKLKAQFVQQSQEVYNTIIDVVDRLTNHKQYIQERLAILKETWEEANKEMAAMEVASKPMNKSIAY